MGDEKRSVSGGSAVAKATVILAAGVLAGGAYLFIQRERAPGKIAMPAPVAPSPAAGNYTEEDEIARVLGQLQSTDPQMRVAGVAMVRQIATDRPVMLADGLPKWVGYLLDLHDFEDVETFTAAAMNEKPQGMPAVSDEQRARVIALMESGKFNQAAAEAKSYFNVATLHDSADARDLLREAMTKAGLSGSMDSITVDDAEYEPAIQRLMERKDSYGTLVGLGNLLLLADRPVEAEKCFERGCAVSADDEKHLQVALEGIARAIRAGDGNVDRANAFLASLQHGDRSKLPKELTGIDTDELVRVSQLIALADSPVGDLPALELARENNDKGAQVTVESGFECSTPVEVTNISPTHLLVRVVTPVYRDWFMFRVRGASGRAVRIDIKNDSGTLDKWWSLNPVYLDAEGASAADCAPAKAWNGAALPDTSQQAWHFIAGAWMQDSSTYSFVQKFSGDDVTVAMRVPYTPADNEAYFNSLAGNSVAKVVEIGRSRDGRPLLLLQIGDAAAGKPCVLIYAGEHADEHDAMWVARGAADFLLSNDPAAAELRAKYTWLIVPMLDPDSSYVSRHEGIIISFLMALKTPESIAYANWFAAWANAGHRLDLVLDLHNRQSHEGTDVEAALMERDGVRGQASLRLHGMLMDNVAAGDFSFSRRPLQWGWSPDRLGGWLSRRFGPITLAYELNSQDPTKHLNLKQLADLGKIFAASAGQFLPSPQGVAALADIDQRRASRQWQMARYVPDKNEDAIVSETKRTRIPLPPDNPILAADENWVP